MSVEAVSETKHPQELLRGFNIADVVPKPYRDCLGNPHFANRVMEEIGSVLLYSPEGKYSPLSLKIPDWKTVATQTLKPQENFQLTLNINNISGNSLDWAIDKFNKRLLDVGDAQRPDKLEKYRNHQPTAYHEACHSLTVGGIGGTVQKRVIGLNGNVRGYVSFSLSSLEDIGTAALASVAGKDIFPEISGFGGDIPQAIRCAVLYNYYNLNGRGDIGQILSRWKSRARSLLSASAIEKEAMEIARENL